MLRELCREFLRNSGPLDEWTPAKVSNFLDACSKRSLLGVSQQSSSGLSLADTFRKHGVRGRQLALLDGFTGNQKLKEPPFSIASLGQRLKLLDTVKVLIEEEVEARVATTSTAATSLGDGNPQVIATGGGSGVVTEMLGRTCKSAQTLGGMMSQGNLMSFVPVWRSTAFPPSGWVDPGEAGRSVPSTDLELEFVFGYNGSRARGNLCCNEAGEIIFPASRIAVVFNVETRTQRFFLEHSDEVSAIAMHPDKVVVASGEHGSKGTICVWDSQNMETLAILTRAKSSSSADAVAAVGVSGVTFADNPLTPSNAQQGELLVAVSQDMMVLCRPPLIALISHILTLSRCVKSLHNCKDQHAPQLTSGGHSFSRLTPPTSQVMVWQWKHRQLIASSNAGTGRVYAARANPWKDRRNFTLVTAGTQSVRCEILALADTYLACSTQHARAPVRCAC